MADENKPITSDTLGQKPERTITVGGQPQGSTENKRDDSGDQTVHVRALKIFHKDGDMKGETCSPGDEFDVSRPRAAQLRANGLIEYVSQDDETDIHGEVDAKRLGEKAKQQADASKIPENSKGSPLRNPEIKLADVKDDKPRK